MLQVISFDNKRGPENILTLDIILKTIGPLDEMVSENIKRPLPLGQNAHTCDFVSFGLH